MTDTHATQFGIAEESDVAGSANWTEDFATLRKIGEPSRHAVRQALIFLALLGTTTTTGIAGSVPSNLTFSTPPALECLYRPATRRRISRKEVLLRVMQILEDADKRRLLFAEEEAARQFEIT